MPRKNFSFELLKKDGAARRGRLTFSPERLIETPAFMPVGTQATVKGILPDDLAATGAQMILCNTYHLMKRPGHELVRELGGLHRFMNWPGGIITDSGGFQVYSLAKRRSLDDTGVTFQHHVDGMAARLEPASALEIQRALGSDIAMVLDECVELPATREVIAKSVARTLAWAKISRAHLAAWESGSESHPVVFAIGQGGTDVGFRLECAQALSEMDFPGYALGGFAVGEPPEVSYGVVEQVAPAFPDAKPRYLMGVGTPQDLVRYVAMGVDLFDCVLPTRNARNGQLFTSRGKVAISNAKYTTDPNPIDPDCTCPVCKKYSAAYLRHLYLAKEILASVLNSLHNLFYYQNLMRELRQAIEESRLQAFARGFFQLPEAADSGSSALS